MENVINKLVKRLQNEKLTLALAESVTCGLAAHKLTTVKGTTDVLASSIVCYQREAKIKLLNISNKLIEQHTAESMQVTEAMAKGLKRTIRADIHAAITGLAAAGGSETKTKPVGTFFLCVLYQGKTYRHRQVFRGRPLQIKTKACLALYKFILKHLVNT
jgi:nicotinamide-nucleotide amidase